MSNFLAFNFRRSFSPIDSETFNYNSYLFFRINATNAKILDNFYFSFNDTFLRVDNSVQISPESNYFASLSQSAPLSGPSFLIKHNFSHIIFSKKIVNQWAITIGFIDIFQGSFSANDETIKLVIGFGVSKAVDYLSFDSNNGEVLFNKSYEIGKNSIDSIVIQDLINDGNQSIMIGYNDINTDSSNYETFIIKIEESLPAIIFKNFTLSNYDIAIPYKIINYENDFIVMGSAGNLENQFFSPKSCFIFRINYNLTEITNFKIISDNLESIKCLRMNQDNDSFLLQGFIINLQFGYYNLFVSKLSTSFEVEKTKYYPLTFSSIGETFISKKMISINNDLFFDTINNPETNIFKLPTNLQEDCLLRYFNLSSSQDGSVSINEKEVIELPKIKVSIEDVETNFTRTDPLSSSIICKNGMLPTKKHTLFPTTEPTNYPTYYPTFYPTYYPTYYPTNDPTHEPTYEPTNYPTNDPTYVGSCVGSLVG